MPKKKPNEETKAIVEQATPEASDVKRQTITPQNLLTFYANGFQIALGPLDVRMYLIETIPLSPTEIVDKQLASVIMTPEALKLLADSIGSFVKQYEAQFGKIRDVAVKIKHTPRPTDANEG